MLLTGGFGGELRCGGRSQLVGSLRGLQRRRRACRPLSEEETENNLELEGIEWFEE